MNQYTLENSGNTGFSNFIRDELVRSRRMNWYTQPVLNPLVIKTPSSRPPLTVERIDASRRKERATTGGAAPSLRSRDRPPGLPSAKSAPHFSTH